MRWNIIFGVAAVAVASLLAISMGSHATKMKNAQEVNRQAGSLAGRRAIVFGGTAGIGQGLAERLAKGGADVTIVGRNEEAGGKIVETLKLNNPNGVHAFIKADLMLLENARTAVNEYLKNTDRLDYVVMCQTKATTQGLTKTAEGIDEKFQMHYYSRVFLSELLAPLLTHTATTYGADVRVMSVLSAGVHSVYEKFQEDFLLETNYGMKNAADAAGFYTDLWIQKAAELHPTITFVHAAPGFVATNWGTDLPVVMKGAVRCMQATPFAKTSADCAELLLPGLVGAAHRGGFKLINENGEPANVTPKQTRENVDFVHQKTRAILDPFLINA